MYFWRQLFQVMISFGGLLEECLPCSGELSIVLILSTRLLSEYLSNLMKSALGAPNGDITVVLVPEHHQAHKELCNDKQKLGENLIQ